MGLLAKGSIITFSGPMLAGNFGAEAMDPFTERHFWQALRSPEFTLEWQGEGRIVGPREPCGAAIWR
jgi:muramoyltetrapeptide carboxypeptidase